MVVSKMKLLFKEGQRSKEGFKAVFSDAVKKIVILQLSPWRYEVRFYKPIYAGSIYCMNKNDALIYCKEGF